MPQFVRAILLSAKVLGGVSWRGIPGPKPPMRKHHKPTVSERTHMKSQWRQTNKRTAQTTQQNIYMKELFQLTLKSTAVFLFGALAFAPAAGAAIINVNFGNAAGDAMNGKSFMYDSGSGAYQQAPVSYTGTAWNDYILANNTTGAAITGASLLDSTGTATAVGFSTAPTDSGGVAMAGPNTWNDHLNVKMLNGGLYRSTGSGSGNAWHNRVTISGLTPGNLYHVVVVGCQQDKAAGEWGIGATDTTQPTSTKLIINTLPLHESWVANNNYVILYRAEADGSGNIYVWGKGQPAPGGYVNGITLNGFQVVDAADLQSPENDMLSCDFGGLGTGWISGTNVNLYVPDATDVASLTPTITVSSGATCSPTTPQNFTSPVQYTVTAQNGTPKVYTVTAIVGPMPVFISTTYTPGPDGPSQGIYIDTTVGTGNTGLLVGSCQTHWNSHGFSVPLILNGNTLIVDTGGGNEPFGVHGQISGDGTVNFNTVLNHRITVDATSTYTGSTVVTRGWIQLAAPTDALLGTITVGSAANAAFLAWSAPDQISDTSDVTLVNGASYLDLAGHSDRIHNLTLPTGTSVQTGAGGVLHVKALTVAGVSKPKGAYIAGSGFVTGSGYIDVDDFGPPVIATVPDGPASPVPTNSATGLHPMMLTKLDWADCAGASSYDVFFWLTGDSKPVTPTATVSISEYPLSLPLVSVTNYNWQVVAQNSVGPTNGPVWTFSTTDRSHISNVLTPAEPAIPAAGVWIDSIVGAGNSGVLVGLCQTHWAHQGFTVPLDLNGNTLIVDSGGGNEPFGVHGSISGNGTVIFNSVVAHRITIDATSTYTGTTLVNRGWIQLAAPTDALCGTITVGTVSSVAFLAWGASDQISDVSDVILVSAGSSLALNDYSDTIKSLTLEDGTFVETGGGGVLTVSSLTVGGVSQGAGTYDQSNSSFVTGGGSVIVVSPLELPLSGFSRPGGVPTFDVPNTVSSSQYTLVYKDNLTNPSWTPLTGSGTGTGNGGTLRLNDPTPTGSLPAHRFYRLERNP
jgi:autotransporter-associated beta strand protein